MSGAHLTVMPIDFATASEFVRRHHRHHTPSIGHRFSLAAVRGERLVGVAIVGRPVARGRQDGRTLEATRLWVDPGEPLVVDRHGRSHVPSTCSFLYAAAARATFALGYGRLGSYVLAREPGTSLIAAGWREVATVRGRRWCPSRPRLDPAEVEDKRLFEMLA